MSEYAEFVPFRLINTPCCNILLCWVNPRLPNYCPECGVRVFMQIKLNPECVIDKGTTTIKVADVKI